MRILIAEDDFTSRSMLVAVLKKAGHEVVDTTNGVEAWAELQKPGAPKLIILDWIMPEMDGLEVLNCVRDLNIKPPAYIIMLTSKDEKADIIAGLNAGADDYLAKPFNLGELKARVEVGRRMVEMQEQLRQAHKLEVIGTMIGGIAHEFNNALQSLFLYAGLVKDQLPEERAIKDDFEKLLETANDAKHLVQQVMLISSQDSGQPEQIVLADLISDVLEQKMAAGLDASHVELTISKNCPPVIGDKQQIQTVLVKVIDNAILAIANGGELSVNLEHDDPASGKPIQSWRVQLTITDTGVGMTEETLSQAFNPFFTTREVGQGKGFGLSIVYNILQNMGGSITATSLFGEGSSFIIEFPVANLIET